MSSWKDTVMSEDEMSRAKKGHTAIMELHTSVYESDRAVAKAQAEISFKAGYQQGFNECLQSSYYNDFMGGKQAGVREVVEWIEGHLIGGTEHYIGIDGRKWQGQKKEWEINEADKNKSHKC